MRSTDREIIGLSIMRMSRLVTGKFRWAHWDMGAWQEPNRNRLLSFWVVIAGDFMAVVALQARSIIIGDRPALQ